MKKISLQELKSWYGSVERGVDNRKTKATSKNHIHKHNKTWLPKTRVVKNLAWKRRNRVFVGRKRIMGGRNKT